MKAISILVGLLSLLVPSIGFRGIVTSTGRARLHVHHRAASNDAADSIVLLPDNPRVVWKATAEASVRVQEIKRTVSSNSVCDLLVLVQSTQAHARRLQSGLGTPSSLRV
jgi:hypothetical protein